MSYIKVDKEQPDDPRVAETGKECESIVRALYADGDVTARYGVTVTLVFGGIVRLWCYADRFILNDNTLPVTLEALAPKIGLPVEVLRKFPEVWLRVRADGRVELPGYVSKNRIVGKDLRKTTNTQREGNRRRQERHRAKVRAAKQDKGAAQPVTGVSVTRAGVTTGTGTGTDRPIPEPAEAPGSLASAGGASLAGRSLTHEPSSNGGRTGGTHGRKPNPSRSRERKKPEALRADARLLASRGMATPDVARCLAQHGVSETDVAAWIAEPPDGPPS